MEMRLIHLHQAAKIMRISYGTLLRLIKQNKVKATKLGGKWVMFEHLLYEEKGEIK